LPDLFKDFGDLLAVANRLIKWFDHASVYIITKQLEKSGKF